MRQEPQPRAIFDFANESGQIVRLCFSHPKTVLVAHSVKEVRNVIRAAQLAAHTGLHVVGFVSYEAAPAFDASFVVASNDLDLPLAWFGVFETPRSEEIINSGRCSMSGWEPITSKSDYTAKIYSIHEAILDGVTYQLNYTIRLRTIFEGDSLAFYERLRRAQNGAYSAYLDIGDHHILSASPELFFRWKDNIVVTNPMKGTIRRGRWLQEDLQNADTLYHSEKDRAENLMIVDLLRNDVSRIAVIGSVKVPHLFDIENYRTVFQMTSTVRAKTKRGTTLEDIFSALFPCGSVTGAPKISTMNLIASLEDTPRGIYCGSIGYISPLGESIFNVAIRTVCINTHTGVAEYGVGGGITSDSTVSGEYNELLAKAEILFEQWPEFDLLETMILENGVYFLAERHLLRLRNSARYFGFSFSENEVHDLLDQCSQKHPQGFWRVRLLLTKQGELSLEVIEALSLPQVNFSVAVAEDAVHSSNRFLYHKTTYRDTYVRCKEVYPELFDVLLWNERDEITEFTTGNVVVQIDDTKWTPPINCGLLAGTFREELLLNGVICERVIQKHELQSATAIWLINSVRRFVAVQLADGSNLPNIDA